MNPPTQYATDANLAARQRLWATSRHVPAFDLFSWVLDLAGLVPAGTASVHDLGCGNGSYEVALGRRAHRGPLVAVDLSMGMLAGVTGASLVQADAQRLPFAPESFSVVLAPHMLYHVSDIPAAVREARRVLRPGGVLVAVTNGISNTRELRSLVERAVGTGWEMVRPADQRFSLENGAAPLSTSFASVTRVDWPPYDLVVTDVDAIADYVASVADHYEAQVALPWSEVVTRVGEIARCEMSAEGELVFSTNGGAFVCR
jgi:SAM-dependent methyltransferase